METVKNLKYMVGMGGGEESNNVKKRLGRSVKEGLSVGRFKSLAKKFIHY